LRCGVEVTTVLTLRVIVVKGFVINVEFERSKLKKQCSTDSKGRRTWGADNWKLMKRRLAVLDAAPDLSSMKGLPGRCHQLTGDRAGQYALSLWGSYRLVFRPDHEPIPRLKDGGISETEITKILIVEVVDYHDK